jgi:hypothetical protein
MLNLDYSLFFFCVSAPCNDEMFGRFDGITSIIMVTEFEAV